MTMVYETRRVVEDFVLFKIHQHLHTSNGYTSSNHEQHNGSSNPWMFPLPQDPPSDVNAAVRRVANDYEERYKAAFPDLLQGIRASHIATCDVDKVFSRVTKNLFSLPNGGNGHHSATSSPSGGRKSRTPPPPSHEDDSQLGLSSDHFDDRHINWGHVIGLLVFAGLMAVRCVETNSSGQVDETVNWVSSFLDTRLRYWLKRQGGWKGFAEWCRHGSKASSSAWLDQVHNIDGMKTAVRVGVMAAFVGFGAMMIARK